MLATPRFLIKRSQGLTALVPSRLSLFSIGEDWTKIEQDGRGSTNSPMGKNQLKVRNDLKPVNLPRLEDTDRSIENDRVFISRSTHYDPQQDLASCPK